MWSSPRPVPLPYVGSAVPMPTTITPATSSSLLPGSRVLQKQSTQSSGSCRPSDCLSSLPSAPSTLAPLDTSRHGVGLLKLRKLYRVWHGAWCKESIGTFGYVVYNSEALSPVRGGTPTPTEVLSIYSARTPEAVSAWEAGRCFFSTWHEGTVYMLVVLLVLKSCLVEQTNEQKIPTCSPNLSHSRWEKTLLLGA